jgi:four helix bundle protein
MGVLNAYKELLVWQKAMTLVPLIYEVSKTFPEDERFGLTSQMRRCSVSIPSNIAEGWGRLSRKKLYSIFKNFKRFFV